MKFSKLFIPGPTHVTSEIMEVFSNPQIGHRTPEISDIINYIVKGIQNLLYTKNVQRINKKTINSCIKMGWATPWFDNPIKPDWLICKLTDEGRRQLEL